MQCEVYVEKRKNVKRSNGKLEPLQTCVYVSGCWCVCMCVCKGLWEPNLSQHLYGSAV